MSPEFECKYLFLMDETVKTTSEVNTLTVDCCTSPSQITVKPLTFLK